MGSPPRLRRLLPLVITPSSTRPQPKGQRERLDHSGPILSMVQVVPAGGCLMHEVAIALRLLPKHGVRNFSCQASCFVSGIQYGFT